MRSYMAVPLMVEGQVIGILQVNSPEPHAFGPADLALPSQVAMPCPSAVAPVPFGNGQQSQSLIIVPLIFERRVLGAMSAQSYEADAYTDADTNLFTTLAGQMAIAIRNAELYQSERAAQQAKTEFLSLI